MSIVHIFFDRASKRFFVDSIQLNLAFAETRGIITALVNDLNRLESRKYLFDPTFVIIFFGFLVVSAYLCLYYWYLFALPIVFLLLIITILAASVYRWSKLRSEINGVLARYQPQLLDFYGLQNSFSHHNSNKVRHPAVSLIPTHERPVVVAVAPAGNPQTSFIPIFNYENSPRGPGNAYQPLMPAYQQVPYDIPLAPQGIPVSPGGDKPLPKPDVKLPPPPTPTDPYFIVTEQSLVPQNRPATAGEAPAIGYYQLPQGLSQIGTMESNRRGSVPQDLSNLYQLNFQSSTAKGTPEPVGEEPSGLGFDNKFDGV